MRRFVREFTAEFKRGWESVGGRDFPPRRRIDTNIGNKELAGVWAKGIFNHSVGLGIGTGAGHFFLSPYSNFGRTKEIEEDWIKKERFLEKHQKKLDEFREFYGITTTTSTSAPKREA